MKKYLQFIVVAIGVAWGSGSIQAATNYWDINGAIAGAGGATPSGIWDTGTTTNWSATPTGVAPTIVWTDNDDAIFSAGTDATGAFNVTVSGAPAVGNLTVQKGAVTISGGTALNVGGGVAAKGIIDVLPTTTLSIGSVISGGDSSGSIFKGLSAGTGTGTLNLTGQNTFNGQVSVNAGTLSFNSIGNVNGGPSALGNPTNTALGIINVGSGSSGATLKYVGAGHSTDRGLNQSGSSGGATIEASGSGPIVFASAAGIMNTGNGVKMLSLTGTNQDTNTIAGPIANFSVSTYTRLEKRDGGTWVLLGANTFSGVCDIRDGTLVVNSVAAKTIPSSIGTGNAGGAHDIIGLGGFGSTNATLKYIGTGHVTTRQIRLWGSGAGGGTVDASGTGTVHFRGDVTRQPDDTMDKVFTLKGSNTGTNTISGEISDSASGYKTSVIKDGPGKWLLKGDSLYKGPTIVLGGTLLINNLGAIGPDSVVTVSSGATFGGSGTANGPVTIGAGGTLAPGASDTSVGTFTLGGNLTLAGNLFIKVNKSSIPSNDLVTVAGTLTNAGTGLVTVSNLGPALAPGDSFYLFDKAISNGLALTIVSPGIVWTNKLAEDGSIAVLSVSAGPTPVPATNVTIVAAGPNSFNLGGQGAANSAYKVYAATNVALPMTNWWLIGTTNSSAGGVIQFLDPQATNQQRFYRFGQ